MERNFQIQKISETHQWKHVADLLPAKGILKRLENEFWIVTAGELLQTISNTDKNVDLERLLQMDHGRITALQKELEAIIFPKESALVQSALNYPSGLVFAESRNGGSNFMPDASIDTIQVPISSSLVHLLPSVTDQGRRGTCAPIAATVLNEFFHQTDGVLPSLSPQFLYCLCKQRDFYLGPGTTLGAVVDALKKDGQCRHETVPYNPEIIPGNEAQCTSGATHFRAVNEARAYRIQASQTIPAGHPKAIKLLLAGFEYGTQYIQARPVLIGLKLAPSALAMETAVKGKFLMPLPGEALSFGHAMVLVGYKDCVAPGGGYFIARNSWGKGWASENEDGAGYGHIPYAFVENHAVHDSGYVFCTWEEKAVLGQLFLSESTGTSPVISKERPIEKKITIGKKIKDNSDVQMPVETLKKHVLCFGGSGSGKSVFGKMICEKALMHGIPVIAIDSQGDLASMAQKINDSSGVPSGKGAASIDYLNNNVEKLIYTPRSAAGIPICANPFKEDDSRIKDHDPIRFDQKIDQLSSIIIHQLKGLPKNKRPFFQGALSKILKYALENRSLDTLDDVIELMYDLPSELQNSIIKVIEPGQFELLKKSFQVLLESSDRYFFDFGLPIDFDLLTGKSEDLNGKTKLSVIYLNGLLNQNSKDYFISIFLEKLYSWMLKNPVKENGMPSLLLFIDEIGYYLPPQNHKKPMCKDILVKLFKQARKYGVCLVGATQSPGDMGYKALGQPNTVLMGRLKTQQDIRKVEQMISSGNMALEKPEHVLPFLKPGEFIAWMPDVFEQSILIKAENTLFRHATLTEEEVAECTPADFRHQIVSQYNARKMKCPKNEELIEVMPCNEEEVKVAASASNYPAMFSKPTQESEEAYAFDQNRETAFEFLYLEHAIDQSRVNSIFKKGLKTNFLLKKTEEILSIDFFYYPMWCANAILQKKSFFSTQNILLPVFLDALGGHFAKKAEGPVKFTQDHPGQENLFEALMKTRLVVKKEPSKIAAQPGLHGSILSKEKIEAIFSTNGFSAVIGLKLFQFPFWQAKISSKEDGQIRKHSIDAIYGKPITFPDF